PGWPGRGAAPALGVGAVAGGAPASGGGAGQPGAPRRSQRKRRSRRPLLLMPAHVLLTTDVVGGIWDFSLALARELHARRSARVTLLALGEPSPAQLDQAHGAGTPLLVESVKLEWMRDCQDDVLRTRDVIGRLVRDLRP